MAKDLGCSEREIETLRTAAVLHDVGKVGISDYIFMKPGPLTNHEFNEMAKHSVVGSQIVSKANFPEPVEEIVRCHHEHWDGSGYPSGLNGEQIPRLARILTVVDCFDALTSDRPYRPALSTDAAVKLMRGQSGKTFDPEILRMFLHHLPQYRLTADLSTAPVESQVGSQVACVNQNWVDRTERHDVLLRNKALNRLGRSVDGPGVLYELLDTLGASTDFQRNLAEGLQILEKMIPFTAGGTFLFERDKYVLVSGHRLPEHCFSRLVVPCDRGLLAQAVDCQRPLIGNGSALDVFATSVSPYVDDFRSTIAVPLLVEEQVVGALLLWASGVGAFSQEHLDFLRLVTAKFGSTLLMWKTVRDFSREAETDSTTNLPNARAAFRHLEAEVNRAGRTLGTVGVLFMDLNGLKPVNDSHGHVAGDRLLLETGLRIRRSLRDYDFLARVGGDEFIAILAGISKDGLSSVIRSLKEVLSKTSVEVAAGVDVKTTISIGGALYPSDSKNPERLVYLSDQAMYEDKRRFREAGPSSDMVHRLLNGRASGTLDGGERELTSAANYS